MRDQVYDSAGIPEFYGIGIMEINELGAAQKFNDIFDAAAGSSTYSKADSTEDHVFNGAAVKDEIIVGLDRSRDSLIRAVAVDAENGSEFNLVADDQYSVRQNKIGYYGGLEEGRMVLDDRALVGLIASGLS